VIYCGTAGTEEDKNDKKDWAATAGYPRPRQTREVYGMYIREVDNILLDNITIRAAQGEVREAIITENVTNLRQRDVFIEEC